jgi:hypothetical protein
LLLVVVWHKFLHTFSSFLIGFSKDPNTFASLNKFISQEGQSNVAYLIGKLETTPICVAGYDECGVCGGNGLSCAPKGCDGIRGRFVCIKNILDCFDFVVTRLYF